MENGGNAVLGYRQHFDLEGETGIAARGYGTACRLTRSHSHKDSMDEIQIKSSPFPKLSSSPQAHRRPETMSSSSETFNYSLPTASNLNSKN